MKPSLDASIASVQGNQWNVASCRFFCTIVRPELRDNGRDCGCWSAVVGIENWDIISQIVRMMLIWDEDFLHLMCTVASLDIRGGGGNWGIVRQIVGIMLSCRVGITTVQEYSNTYLLLPHSLVRQKEGSAIRLNHGRKCGVGIKHWWGKKDVFLICFL